MIADVLKLLGLVVIYAGVSGYGLLLLKQAELGFNSRLILGGILYGLGFLVWLWILREHPLSVAFPVAAGSLMIATQLFGMSIGEPLSVVKFVGILVILGGIWIVSAEPFK